MPVANVSTRTKTPDDRRLHNRLFVFQNPSNGRDGDENVARISEALDQFSAALKALTATEWASADPVVKQAIVDMRAAEETLKEVLFEERARSS
jgi:hypothetical protein